jgi:hypothetical protein
MGAPKKPRPLSIHHIMWFGENSKIHFAAASSSHSTIVGAALV